MSNLILHCGAQHISRDGLAALPMPTPMGSRHNPVPHIDFVEAVDATLDAYGLQRADEAFGVTENGAKFFGVIDVTGDRLPATRDYSVSIGLRGSHDQTLPRGISIGSHVFVCDNLAFSGEQIMKTKHTTNIEERLPEMLYQMMGTIITAACEQAVQIEDYKAAYITDRMADAAMMQLVRRNAIVPTDLPKLLHEWDDPAHEEFDAPTVWRLFNAATETLKPRRGNLRLPTLAPRTTVLHDVCDELAMAA